MSSRTHGPEPMSSGLRGRWRVLVRLCASLVLASAVSCAERAEREDAAAPAGPDAPPGPVAAGEPDRTRERDTGKEPAAEPDPAPADVTAPAPAAEPVPAPAERVPAVAGEVAFLPTPSGTIGAFLVSGPHEATRPDIEAGARAVEGDAWRLAVTRGSEKGVTLRSAGGRNVFYLYTSVQGRPDATSRTVSFASSGRITCWIGGVMAGTAEAYGRKGVRTADGRSTVPVLFRVDASRSVSAAVVAATLQTAPDTVVADRAVLTIADAGRERVARLVADSLDLRITPGMARRDDEVIAMLLRTGACPVVAGELVARLSLGGRSLGEFDVPSLERMARDPVTVRYRASLVGKSPYELRAEVGLDGEKFVSKSSQGHTLDGVLAMAGELERRARGGGGFESARAFARLQAEKARLALKRPGGVGAASAIGRDLAEAKRALDEAEAGRDFQRGLTGSFERAYVSEIDDSPQPYLAYVPTGCREGTGPWPMVVYLHGYVPSYDKDDWVNPDPNFNAVMESEGCILAVPFGRSNTDFLNVGEDDVLRVIDEMARDYPVDESRIYLYGYSMGGSGVWTLLGHYPGRFAAAVVLAGRSDYYLWHGLDRARVPPWKRHIIDADNPIDQAHNMVHVPVRVYHGDADYVVKTDQSKRMVARLKELGGTAELHWVRNGSHWSLFDAVMWSREPVAWVKKHVRPPAASTEFELTAFHPRYAAGWGAEVCGARRELEPMKLACARAQNGDVSLNVGNAECVAILPRLLGGRRPVLGRGFAITSADGTELGWNARHGEDGVAYYSDAWRRPGLRKTNKLCGPVKEAFRSPFVLVYGTAGDAGSDRTLRARAERFAKEWRDFAKGRPAVYADIEVNDEIMSGKNLVVFGESKSNSFIARVAGGLPIRWDRASADIGGTSHSLESRGMVFVYPNPLAPRRLAVFMSGLYWGDALPINHKWDFVPDFVVFEGRVDPLDRMDPVNEAVVAGFFDVDWRPRPELTFVRGRRGVPVPAPRAVGAD